MNSNSDMSGPCCGNPGICGTC